jgi:hypothetical protein
MNLGQIKQKVRMLGRHYFGGEHDRDPFGLDYIILEATNDIARKTDCYVGRRYLSTVGGTSDYCSPDIYKIRVIRIKDQTGDYTEIKLASFSDQILDDYRNMQPEYVPQFCVVHGMNKIVLMPPPSTSVTNGLLIEGYAQPGDYWQYDSNGDPVANTDTTECPLPEMAHDCLVYNVLYLRAMQLRDMDGMTIYKGEYLDRLGHIESNAAMYVRRSV